MTEIDPSAPVIEGVIVPDGASPAASVAVRADTTFRDDLARRWWESFADDSPATAARYRHDIGSFFAWADANGYDVFRMLPMHVQEYRGWLAQPDRVQRYTRKTKLSDSTVAGRLAAVSSFYRFVQEQVGDRVIPNPAAGIRRPKPPTESNTPGLAKEEVDEILRVADMRGRREYALVLLLATTGLRVSEACDLDTGDLVRDAGSWALQVKRKGFGNSRILVTCPDPTARALRRYMRGRRGAMFQGENGERMTRRQASYWIASMAKAALGDPEETDAPRVTPHVFRHTATTLALNKGVPREVVAAQMGHRSTQTTDRYDRADRRRNNQAAKVLGALFDDGRTEDE